MNRVKYTNVGVPAEVLTVEEVPSQPKASRDSC